MKTKKTVSGLMAAERRLLPILATMFGSTARIRDLCRPSHKGLQILIRDCLDHIPVSIGQLNVIPALTSAPFRVIQRLLPACFAAVPITTLGILFFSFSM